MVALTFVLPVVLAFARLLPMAAAFLGLSRGALPGTVVWSTALSLAVFFAEPALLPTPSEADAAALLVMVLRELAIGGLLALGCVTPLFAFGLATRGVGRAALVEHEGAWGAAYSLAVMAVLIRLGFHRALVSTLSDVFAAIPAGAAFPARSSWLSALLSVLGSGLLLAVALLLPWLLAVLCIDLSFALSARAFGRSAGDPARSPLRVLLVSALLLSALVPFAERAPEAVRAAFALVQGALRGP